MLDVSPDIQIPDAEIMFTFVRSSGPGGQNVNKVNSKAVLRWNARESEGFSPFVHARVLARLAPRLNEEDELVITGDRFRDQGRNREDCLEKLRGILELASKVEKKRKKTKPTFSSRQKTLRQKRNVSDKKQSRKRPFHDD